MNRNIQFIIILILIISIHHLLYAQDSTGVKIKSEQWKWQESYQKISINLGYDTLSAPPSFKGTDHERWWKILGYTKLNVLVELALAENHHLKVAKSQVEESRARVQVAKSFLYPSLSFNPSFLSEEFSANRPLPFDIAAQRVRINTYVLPVDLTYEVDLFGKVRNDIDASQFGLQTATALQEASNLAIAAEVARNFAILLTLDSEIAIMERTIHTREENLEIVKTRYLAGLTNEIDLQRAQTELSSLAVQLKSNQIKRTEVELALATLCGQPVSNFSIERSGIQYLVPRINPKESASLGVNRPDIQAAKYSAEAYAAQTKSVRKEMYPALNIGGSAGLLAGESGQIFESDSRNWLIGATLSVPLFEGGRRRAQLAISNYQLQAAMSNLKQQELTAYQEVERELSHLARLNEQLLAQQEFLTAARRAADLSHQRYRKGLVTYLEVVDAERVVLEAETLSIQLLGQQLLSTVDLIVAMGGDLGMFDKLEN